jgi:hypothetical protein
VPAYAAGVRAGGVEALGVVTREGGGLRRPAHARPPPVSQRAEPSWLPVANRLLGPKTAAFESTAQAYLDDLS